MTGPLTQAIAKTYDYDGGSFRHWSRNYVDSLNLDTLKFKPIKNINLYLLRGFSSSDDKYFFLDAEYIYLLSSPNGNTHFIPVEEPFAFGRIGGGSRYDMNGLYVVRNNNHTYTTQGFNNDSYKIIGVAPFPKTGLSRFLNWKDNPLGVK